MCFGNSRGPIRVKFTLYAPSLMLFGYSRESAGGNITLLLHNSLCFAPEWFCFACETLRTRAIFSRYRSTSHPSHIFSVPKYLAPEPYCLATEVPHTWAILSRNWSTSGPRQISLHVKYSKHVPRLSRLHSRSPYLVINFQKGTSEQIHHLPKGAPEMCSDVRMRLANSAWWLTWAIWKKWPVMYVTLFVPTALITDVTYVGCHWWQLSPLMMGHCRSLMTHYILYRVTILCGRVPLELTRENASYDALGTGSGGLKIAMNI